VTRFALVVPFEDLAPVVDERRERVPQRDVASFGFEAA
jgi:hypothetical protein